MDDGDVEVQLFDAEGNPDEEAILAHLAYLEQQIEDHNPDQFFMVLFVALFFDISDLPMELLDLIPVGGWIFTAGITGSEGIFFWLMLLGKGTLLRVRMRFWLWIWTFFEAIVPFGALLPMRTLVILHFAAKNRKKYKELVAERDQVLQLLAYVQNQEAANDNVPYSAAPSLPPSQIGGMESAPPQALTRGNFAPRSAANDNASKSRAA